MMLIVLHWLTFLILVIGLTCILTRELLDGRAVRQWLLDAHRDCGLSILVLTVCRLGYRFRLGRLPPTARMPRLQHLAASATHAAMYLLLLAQPVIGWAMSSAADKPPHLFGFSLPYLVAPDEDLADRLAIWHADVAWVLLSLIVMHIAAALWHHFFRRDRVLRAMWPAGRRAP
nr:cytochrome b [Dyella soli]